MKIRTFKLTPKQIRRHYKAGGTDAHAFYRPTKDQHYIVIPHRVSTKTRLHELAHCLLGHCKITGKPLLVSEYIAQELEAEAWAFEHCGKDLSIDAILNVAHQAMIYGVIPNFTFTTSLKVLARHNYRLNHWQRSKIWQTLREYQKEIRA